MLNNEILWFIMLFISFSGVLLLYRLYGIIGLYTWIPVATILANIQVIKMINIFGFESTLGNILYSSSFLVTDILSENHGRKAASKAVYIGFFALLSTTVLMNMALLFKPSSTDFSQKSLEMVFNLMPRLAVASFIAYFISQLHDVWAFDFWKKRFPKDKHLWIRNNFSTVVSQFFDTTIFTLIAFAGVFETKVLVEIFLTAFVLKLVVAVLDTPFIYLARKIKAD